DNLQQIRNRLTGDFAAKVTHLNDLTKVLALNEKLPSQEKPTPKPWKKLTMGGAAALFLMVLGYGVSFFFPLAEAAAHTQNLLLNIEPLFYWMILAGFAAQMVDGALGMGYGVTCTTILMSLGVNLPAISGSIHTAEVFSSGASGYNHYRF